MAVDTTMKEIKRTHGFRWGLQAMKLKDACSLESYDKPRQCIKKAEMSFC